MNYFFEGFILQASLILALGAQNIFVLEAGLNNQRNLLVAAICSICDTLLISIGVLGAASIFVRYPNLKIFFGILGVIFMAFYGLKSFQKCFKDASNIGVTNKHSYSAKKTILIALGFSLLNPHVYLDTIVLIGGYATKLGSLEKRAMFGAGAASFSTVWFFGLSYCAQMMSSILNNPKSMKTISFISGLVLIILTWKLAHDVYQWISL